MWRLWVLSKEFGFKQGFVCQRANLARAPSAVGMIRWGQRDRQRLDHVGTLYQLGTYAAANNRIHN